MLPARDIIWCELVWILVGFLPRSGSTRNCSWCCCKCRISRIFVSVSPVLRIMNPSRIGCEGFWCHWRGEGVTVLLFPHYWHLWSYLDDIGIRVQCQVTVKLDGHGLDQRGELSRGVSWLWLANSEAAWGASKSVYQATFTWQAHLKQAPFDFQLPRRNALASLTSIPVQKESGVGEWVVAVNEK